MSRTSIATPCPAPYHPARRISLLSVDGLNDDTADIEYTRAIQHDLRCSKPIRRTSNNAPKSRRNAPIQIFEDVLEDEELAVDANRRLAGKTLLGRPAQRIRGCGTKKAEVEGGFHKASQARRQSSLLESTVLFAESDQKADGVIQRNSRRRTIFVPTDDTTIMTIHPGADSTERLNDTFHMASSNVSQVNEKIGGEESSHVAPPTRPVRRPRRSLAVAPRRLPLAQMEIEYNISGIDMPGQGGGKENIPPQNSSSPDGKKRPVHFAITDSIRLSPAPTAANHRVGMALDVKLTRPAVTSGSQEPIHAHGMSSTPTTEAGMPADSFSRHRITTTKPVQTKRRASPTQSQLPASHAADQTAQRKAVKTSSYSLAEKKPRVREFIASVRSQMEVTKAKQYPVLSEDLAHAELYEDGWLSQQEVALTEVINEIFMSAKPELRFHASDQNALRAKLIEIYHQPETLMLHRRLQASISCGGLKRPGNTTKPLSLGQDLGLKKRYLHLWLDSYDHGVLETAAEVVVGRQIPRPSSNSIDPIRDAELLLDPSAGRRALIDFLETFFVDPSDVEHDFFAKVDESESATARYRKTMLRSLMLLWLLDQAKTLAAVKGCLFKTKSTNKSSIAVLHTLSGLLVPSVGDVSRVLRQMKYEVTHAQGPLDEIQYHVDNLAVDLRDGVLLARLVELLFYPNTSSQSQCDRKEGTIAMRNLDSLVQNTDNSRPRPISQQLRLPAIGRVQMIHNVQLSLSILSTPNLHPSNICTSITSADIVDGHREKTLSLLWSLVSIRGLNHLVDWKTLSLTITNHPNSSNSATAASTLLQAWANTHALAANLPPVQNLTTSFADGKIYVSILTSFARYLPTSSSSSFPPPPPPSSSSTTLSSPPTSTLKSHLQALGCSKAFTQNLISNLNLIPSRETTLSNLAFLASRLLPLAKRQLAAEKIQRVWRERLVRREGERKIILKELAEECGRVVEARERVLGAAGVIQRAWRGVLDRRVGRLERDIGELQALIRGWGVRKGVNGGGGGAKWGW